MAGLHEIPTILISDSDSENDVMPRKRMKLQDGAAGSLTRTMPYMNFSHEVRCDFGQRAVECSGIAIAVLKLYQLRQLGVDNSNKNEIARRLLNEGRQFYDRGTANELIEEGNGHIELRSIYDSRNDRDENVIVTSPTSSFAFESAYTALIRPDNLQSYTEGTPKDNFVEVFHQKGYEEEGNFIVCKRGAYGGHFISVVKQPERYLLVDGQGAFRFLLYNSLELLLIDLKNFVEGCAFNLHTAHFFGKPTAEIPIKQATPLALKAKDDPRVKAPHTIKKAIHREPIAVKKDGDNLIKPVGKVKYDDPELPVDFGIDYLGNVPIFSSKKKIMGVCAFENCLVASVQGFCTVHSNQVFRIRDAMAQRLRVKCEFAHQDCKGIAIFGRNVCLHHSLIKVTEDDNLQSNEAKAAIIQKIIDEVVIPLINAGIFYYLGCTSNINRRQNEWISDLKGTDEKGCDIILEELYSCAGEEEGLMMEKMFISACMLHKNHKVRSMLLNTCGGQSARNQKLPGAKYVVYIRYNKLGYGSLPEADKNEEHLKPSTLMRFFRQKINSSDIISRLKAGKFIYFGLTGSDVAFKGRMMDHNCTGRVDYVHPSKFSSCQLIEKGDKVVHKDGTTEIINELDIKTLEVIAISEFSFGKYSTWRSRVLNQSGGGEAWHSKSSVLYFRYGSFNQVEKIREQEKNDIPDKPYFTGILARNDKNNIVWSDLFPLWKVVIHCGSKMQKIEEGGFACVCGKKYVFKPDLTKHRKGCEQAGGKKTVVVCGIGDCKAEYLHETSRLRHIKNVHENPQNRRSVGTSARFINKKK